MSTKHDIWPAEKAHDLTGYTSGGDPNDPYRVHLTAVTDPAHSYVYFFHSQMFGPPNQHSGRRYNLMDFGGCNGKVVNLHDDDEDDFGSLVLAAPSNVRLCVCKDSPDNDSDGAGHWNEYQPFVGDSNGRVRGYGVGMLKIGGISAFTWSIDQKTINDSAVIQAPSGHGTSKGIHVGG